MKMLIKRELEKLKNEYGYIPQTSKMKRSLLYKIADNYSSTEDCIKDLVGEEECKLRKEIFSQNRMKKKNYIQEA